MKKRNIQRRSPRRKTHIFDKLFKQLMHLSKKAVIHFINGLFGVNHPLNSKISYPNTEYVTPDWRRYVSDMVIVIGGCKYQLEAQIGNDWNMALRVFRYGFEESQRSRVLEEGEITLPFPQVRVIYWETTRKTPDMLTVNLIFPDGTRHKYRAAAFKFLDHSIAELERRKMSILLPFYVLKLRKQVRAAKTGKRRQALSAEMRALIDELEKTAERSAKAGVLDEDDLADVLEQISRLHYELYQGYTEFKEMERMREVKVVRWSEKMKRIGRREERLEIARNLKIQGIPSEKIVAATGLPLKAVEKL
jgi:hypothetical protein